MGLVVLWGCGGDVGWGFGDCDGDGVEVREKMDERAYRGNERWGEAVRCLIYFLVCKMR